MKSRRSKQEPKLRIPPERHEVASTTTLSGALVGATTGLMGGPPGIVAGGVIGGAIGALAGTVLERDRRDGFVHDVELDEEIGVVGGDIGARGPAARGVDAIEREERESLAEFERESSLPPPSATAPPSTDAPSRGDTTAKGSPRPQP